MTGVKNTGAPYFPTNTFFLSERDDDVGIRHAD